MTIESFPVTDRAEWLRWREQDVTASVVAALFGPDVHPYMSPFHLFALKAGLIQEDPEETPAMRRGRLLEPVALELLREERPTWDCRHVNRYFRDTVHRVGGTPGRVRRAPRLCRTWHCANQDRRQVRL